MKKISILSLLLFCFLFCQSQLQYLKGSLQGTQETPPNAEKGSGVVIVKYNKASKTLQLYGDYAALSDSIVGSHIHEGAPGAAGPIIIPLANTGDTTGTLLVTAVLTQPQEDSLLAGNMYANVHTKKHPAGELRAQLTLTSAQTTFLSARLQGTQETPPDTSKATGTAYALVDMSTDSVFVSGHYSGLTAASILAHVHLQNPGTAGPVLFPIYHSFAPAGAVHAAVLVSVGAADSIMKGLSYVNVHTSTYPSGEIRGQLLNNTGMRYFAGNLSGANETPPNLSGARGTVIVSYNTETNLLQLNGDYQHLSDTVVGSHIHRGAAGVAGPVIIPINNSRDSTGTVNVTVTLPDSLEADLLAGNMYVNVHSALFPNGEIRTQLVPTTNGNTQVFKVNLTTDQVVKPTVNPSAANGNALIIVDNPTGLTYVTGAFQGINSNAISAHIHRGPVGDTSSVILSLNIAQRSPVPHGGTFSGSGTLSASLIDSMTNGLAYVDVHSSFYTHGAMRGQLGGLILPLKLTYFNGYKQANKIELIWETSEEVNISHYEIEQYNIATKDWIKKGTVYPQGGSNAAKYTFEDLPNLYNGSSYVMYRLKIIDKDGKITYSSMIRLNYETLKAALFIQTNPIVNGVLRYTITGLATGKKAEISIMDYNGRMFFKNTISSLINNTLEIHNLSAGMYKLIVKVDDTILQQSFIK